jgi:folate-dependent tRNA-U54 methylase TrmFO/GidA
MKTIVMFDDMDKSYKYVKIDYDKNTTSGIFKFEDDKKYLSTQLSQDDYLEFAYQVVETDDDEQIEHENSEETNPFVQLFEFGLVQFGLMYFYGSI